MQAEKAKLSNGLEVVYLHLPSSQQFKVILNVPIGAVHDPVHRDGLSHVLEHTAFCGTESTNETDLLNSIRAAGGEYGASTGLESTHYTLSASTQDVDNFFLISNTIRQIIAEPAFIPERVAIEKKVIINERGDNIDDLTQNPLIELSKAMNGSIKKFPDIIGTKESILSITSDHLRQFMKQNYDAGHMTLYASGSLGFESAIDVLEQTVSAIPNLDLPKKNGHEIQCSETDIRNLRSDLEQNYTAFMFVLPKARTVKENLIQFEAQRHLSTLLPEKLRSQYGCVYGIKFGLWDSDNTTSVNYLTMSNTPDDSVLACQGMQEFVEEIDNIVTDNVIKGSLNRQMYLFSNPDRIDPNILGLVEIQHHEFDTLFSPQDTLDILQTITPDEVRQRAKSILGSIMGMYVQGPKPDALPTLKSMKEVMNSSVENLNNASTAFLQHAPQI